MVRANIEWNDLESSSPATRCYDVRNQLKDHIYRRIEAACNKGEADRSALDSVASVEERKRAMRSALQKSIGGIPASTADLAPAVSGTVEAKHFRIEKIIFQSRPGVFVASNLYLPRQRKDRGPAVLFLCGHLEAAKQDPEYQTVCQIFALSGFVVMAMDPIGQGERLSYFDGDTGTSSFRWGTGEHDYAGSQCLPLGDGIARYFLHDAIRAVDYLRTRPDVDPDWICVTGNSGGGTQTSLMMMADERIAAAAPGTYITGTREFLYVGNARDCEQVWPGILGLGFDHVDILMSMAPRPVLVLAASWDSFPIEGTRRTVQEAERIWKLYGAAGRVRLFEEECGHHYTPAMARQAAAFFSAHMEYEMTAEPEDAVQIIEPDLLQCTTSGQIRSDYPESKFVFEENLERLAVVEGERRKTRSGYDIALSRDWLKARVFSSREACEPNPRRISESIVGDMITRSYIWWSQKGVLNYGVMFRSPEHRLEKLPVTVAVWDGGTSRLLPHRDWIQATADAGRAVLVVDTSGVGNLLPNPLTDRPVFEFKGVLKKLAVDLIWLGDSTAALRVYDVVRTADAVSFFPDLDPTDIRLYSHGRQGIYARLAAWIDDRFGDCDVEDGWHAVAGWVRSRHYDHRDIFSVILPGMLQYFDFDDLADPFRPDV
jgi:cephalosporin-C deacetylase-like acetyl esterase